MPALRVPFDEEVVEALARAGVGRGGECAAPAVQAETDASCETDPLAHAVAWVPAAGAWPVVFACCGGLTIAALPMVPPEARSEAVAGSQGARRRVQGGDRLPQWRRFAKKIVPALLGTANIAAHC